MADRSVNRRRFLGTSAAVTGWATLAAAAQPGSDEETAGGGAESGTVGVITHEGGAHLGLYFTSLAEAEEVASVVLSDPSGESVPEARKALGEKLAGVWQ